RGRRVRAAPSRGWLIPPDTRRSAAVPSTDHTRRTRDVGQEARVPGVPGPADYLVAQDVLPWRGTTITVRTWARWPYGAQAYQSECRGGPMDGACWNHATLGGAEEGHREVVHYILASCFGADDDDDGGRTTPLLPRSPDS